MDKLKQKIKRDKSQQCKNKDKCASEEKSIRETIQIKEILRNVKMNSSMRLKAPTGSKVMNNKDFSDSEDCFEDTFRDENGKISEPVCAVNPMVTIERQDFGDPSKETSDDSPPNPDCDRTGLQKSNSEVNLSQQVSRPVKYEAIKRSESMIPDARSVEKILNNFPSTARNRKLSLDQAILGNSFSQSEVNLHSLGQYPLKSSFFRKKMDSFFRNTAQYFKKQNKPSEPTNGSRSLQSLNENIEGIEINQEDSLKEDHLKVTTSEMSLLTEMSSSPQLYEQPSNPSTVDSSTLSIQNQCLSSPCTSVPSLNEAFIQESMMPPRAISMSSGLDNTNLRKRKSRSNRVTWLASEGLTNYFRRVIQDEKSKEKMKSFHSYQDFSSIPENESYVTNSDTMGRRLSYQRAVSGEDPVRRRNISDKSEANYDLQCQLAEFTKNGVPSLQGFVVAPIPETSFSYLMWSEQAGNLVKVYDWKTLDDTEQKKQAVIRELVETEANYIQHLMVIVEVFIAAAHALQDSGKMLELDTAKLFSNIPDLLNANLIFWNLTFYPMVKHAVEHHSPYKTELMADGFSRFQEIFQPYEKYMTDQGKMVLYLRHMQNDPEFAMYLNWCYSNKSCNRLQLADLLVKPMQRLTKYQLMLGRAAACAKTTEESVSLRTMETSVKCYVTDLNRAMRQREEIDRLDELSAMIEPYELDFKDEEMERAFRTYCALNLRSPMLNSTDLPLRNLLYECDLRFKDNIGKETEIRLFLLTDMMLICKKQSKTSTIPYRMIRPKIFLERLVSWQKSSKVQGQVNSLVYVILDDCSSAVSCFTLTESTKDPTSTQNLKALELKIKEARLSRAMYVWAAMNPSRDLSEMESSDSSGMKSKSPEDAVIELEARERVTCMLHRSMGVSTDECSITTDSNEGGEGRVGPSSTQRQYMHRLSTASSRQSRLSSFQQSLSATSRDEPQAGPAKVIYRASSSLDQTVTSITVNMVNESETSATSHDPPVTDGLLVHVTPAPESPNSLAAHPQNNVSVLSSHPDLSPEAITISFSGPSASERLYQSHQELLQRNRLAASHSSQYLTPDHRGSSYPPPSPTRGSLKRSLAFSYSFKNPPLSKMGNVHSQSHLDAAMYASQQLDRQLSPSLSEKSEKKNKILGSRGKASSSQDPDEPVSLRHTSESADTFRDDDEVE